MDFIPFAVAGASILGSGHCVAMCGGIALIVSRDRPSLIKYHLGRLWGYCTLGGLAGLLGQTVFQASSLPWVPWLSSVLLATSFVYVGINVWSGRPPHLPLIPSRIFQKFTNTGPVATGLLTALLPCGWLHTFVLGAIATQSPSLGALYLFFFWMGTLPAMILGPLAVHQFFKPLVKESPRLSAIILISIGLGTLGFKMAQSQTSDSCHCHELHEVHPALQPK
jgi:sulfite exporter TauE/SafE